MPKKHEPKAPHQIAELPKELIKMMISDKKDRDRAAEEIADGGPYHKQVLSALLLDKSYQLVQKVSALSGKHFQQKGTVVQGSKEEKEIALPVLLALNESAKHGDEIAEAVAQAPAHESLAYLMAIQAIEWSLGNIGE